MRVLTEKEMCRPASFVLLVSSQELRDYSPEDQASLKDGKALQDEHGQVHMLCNPPPKYRARQDAHRR